MPSDIFRFRQFTIRQDRCAMKVGVDGLLLGAWAGVENVRRVLDIGAGTGLIALMLAQRAPGAEVHGVEIDASSAQQAAENAAASPWAERVRIFHASIQEYALSCREGYDLIVSNPPYFNEGLKPPLKARSAARHTESLTHTDLLRAANALLAQGGRFCLILPERESRNFQLEVLPNFLFTTRRQEVVARPGRAVKRVLLELGKENRLLRSEPALALHGDAYGGWSAEYWGLAGAFYLPPPGEV